MWSTTISEDFIKNVINFGTSILDVINNLGGLVPVLLAIGAAIAVLKWETISTSLASLIPMLQLIGSVLLPGIIPPLLGVATAEGAVTASTALMTGGLSLLVAALVLLIANIDKIIPSMVNLNEKFQKNKEATATSIDDLDSLASEYENLANKADKSSEDLARLLDIQTILNTKYGAAKDGITTYTDAIDGNSIAIQENIKWMKERAKLEAENFLEQNRDEYQKAVGYLSSPEKTSGQIPGLNNLNPEETIDFLNRQIELTGDSTGAIRKQRDAIFEQVSAAQQLIIDYEHFTNVLKVNSDAIDENYDAGIGEATALAELTYEAEDAAQATEELVSSTDSLTSSMDAVAKAAEEQAREGQISNATAMELISSNADLANYLRQTADGYIFDAEAAKAATQAEMINELTKYGLRDAAIAAANGNYIFAQSAIASSNATKEEKESMIGLLKAFAAMNVSVSIPSSGGGSAVSAQEKLNNAKKESYELEIKAYNAQKKSAQAQIDALEDQKDAYSELIDAKKESLRLTKEEDDYQKELADKNKELSDIDNELLQLQFDNSEEANARRLELEEERAEKTADIAEYQADRTYDIQIEALDREEEAFNKLIDAQIAGIDRMISGFDAMIAKINEMIDALSKANDMGGGSGGSGGYTQPTQKADVIGSTGYNYSKTTIGNAEVSAGRDLNGNGKIGLASGGSFEVLGSPSNVDSRLLPVAPGEIGLALTKSQQNSVAPLASFFSSILRNTGTVPRFSNANNGFGDITVTIPIAINGNLDRSILPEMKEIVTKIMVDTFKNRGITRNATSFTI
jgi:hypothetical protein